MSLGEFEGAALALANLTAKPVRALAAADVDTLGAGSEAERLWQRALAFIDTNLSDQRLNLE